MKPSANPLDPGSARTQIATTVSTYRIAAGQLKGRVLDYGAGLGLGSDVLRENGLEVDSYEPFPQRWKGRDKVTYTDSSKIPSGRYDGVVCFSVLNVVDPEVRYQVVKTIGRVLKDGGVALVTARTVADVSSASVKRPLAEPGAFAIGKRGEERYQKGFGQKELEEYVGEVLGADFTVDRNRLLNGASVIVRKTRRKPSSNPRHRSPMTRTVRKKLEGVLERGDRVLDYDRASLEDLYKLYDVVVTDQPLNETSLREVEGLLDARGVLVIVSGEQPPGLEDHFRKAGKFRGMLMVEGPLDPEGSRIAAEEERSAA